MLRPLCASLLLLVGTSFPCLAETPAKENAQGPTAGSEVPTLTIDFAKELGLNFSYLTSLGLRIEQAKSAPDPVGLYTAANELAVAESVSGKKTAVSPKELRELAITLGRLRGDQHELNALAILVQDEPVKKELLAAAGQAKTLAANRKAAFDAGEKSKGVYGELIVNNNTHEHLDIYYDGRYLGCVGEHEHEHFSVDDHEHDNHFDLRARDHHGRVWSQHVHGDYPSFTWNLR